MQRSVLGYLLHYWGVLLCALCHSCLSQENVMG